jgi:MraZ protein
MGKIVVDNLDKLSIGKSDSRGFGRYLLGSAREIDIDSIGRILLPDNHQEYAGLSSKTKVVFAGVYSRVEIWEEAKWKAYQDKVVKEADQLAEKLGEMGAI